MGIMAMPVFSQDKMIPFCRKDYAIPMRSEAINGKGEVVGNIQ